MLLHCTGAGVDKMVSAKYLQKYFTYPHQIWYTEAPGQVKDQGSNRVTLALFSRSHRSCKGDGM